MKKTLPILFLLTLISISCSDSKIEKNNLVIFEELQKENDSLKNVIAQKEIIENQQVITFLTFQKEDAEQAMNFYVRLFDNSEVVELKRWGKEGPGKEGTIMQATFSLNGKLFMCSDSPPIHNWDFSPAISNYVACKSKSELENLFNKLSENGQVMMPPGNYGFSQQFAWAIDQFGISWQLDLP